MTEEIKKAESTLPSFRSEQINYIGNPESIKHLTKSSMEY